MNTARLLQVARAEVGVVEEGGPNRGSRVEQYQRAVGLKPGDPWCAAFVNWCGHKALEAEWLLPMVGGCASLGDFGFRHGLLHSEPRSGAIFLLYFPKLRRFAHTGFCDVPVSGGWATIEGNCNPAGGREGYGVFSRVRSFGPADRFLWW